MSTGTSPIKRLDIFSVGYRELKIAQRGFLVCGILYLIFLFASAAVNSRGRNSLSSINSFAANGSQSVISHREGDDVSKLRIQDFHRLEVKGGRPVWEIRASDANYFHLQGTTHVNDASVTVYRPKQKPVRLHSDTARLTINGSSLLGATLEGHVNVEIEGSLQANCEVAEYEAATRLIKAPDKVNIHGDGYEVIGAEMEMQIDSENIRLRRNVLSRFEPGAKAPTGVGFKEQK
jgi:LPS export ABC transporter protein LptC